MLMSSCSVDPKSGFEHFSRQTLISLVYPLNFLSENSKIDIFTFLRIGQKNKGKSTYTTRKIRPPTRPPPQHFPHPTLTYPPPSLSPLRAAPFRFTARHWRTSQSTYSTLKQSLSLSYSLPLAQLPPRILRDVEVSPGYRLVLPVESRQIRRASVVSGDIITGPSSSSSSYY